MKLAYVADQRRIGKSLPEYMLSLGVDLAKERCVKPSRTKTRLESADTRKNACYRHLCHLGCRFNPLDDHKGDWDSEIKKTASDPRHTSLDDTR